MKKKILIFFVIEIFLLLININTCNAETDPNNDDRVVRYSENQKQGGIIIFIDKTGHPFKYDDDKDPEDGFYRYAPVVSIGKADEDYYASKRLSEDCYTCAGANYLTIDGKIYDECNVNLNIEKSACEISANNNLYVKFNVYFKDRNMGDYRSCFS